MKYLIILTVLMFVFTPELIFMGFALIVAFFGVMCEALIKLIKNDR